MRVLVADNDATWLDLLALDLRLEGFEVVGTVESAAAALDRLAAGGGDLDVDVLVADHRMPPGLTGVELLEAVHREHPGLRCVLFTNYDLDAAARSRVAAVGATYVAKPDLRALRAAISSVRSAPPPPPAGS